MLLGCGNPHDSRVYECFDAPWWRIDRWINWWFGKGRHDTGYATIDNRQVRIRTKHRATIRKL